MSLEQPIILLQIIFIDIVMAADNAIIIGLIAANYSPDNRKKIIAFGVAAAFIFRVIFALSATFLLAISWMKILGGVLLIWVINNLRQDLFAAKRIKSPNYKAQENTSFGTGVYRVLVADTIISLDNVLGVAGAAGDHYILLIFGLALSIILMATAATIISRWINEYKWIAWIGLIAILVVAIELIYTDLKLFI